MQYELGVSGGVGSAVESEHVDEDERLISLEVDAERVRSEPCFDMRIDADAGVDKDDAPTPVPLAVCFAPLSGVVLDPFPGSRAAAFR